MTVSSSPGGLSVLRHVTHRPWSDPAQSEPPSVILALIWCDVTKDVKVPDHTTITGNPVQGYRNA